MLILLSILSRQDEIWSTWRKRKLKWSQKYKYQHHSKFKCPRKQWALESVQGLDLVLEKELKCNNRSSRCSLSKKWRKMKNLKTRVFLISNRNFCRKKLNRSQQLLLQLQAVQTISEKKRLCNKLRQLRISEIQRWKAVSLDQLLTLQNQRKSLDQFKRMDRLQWFPNQR